MERDQDQLGVLQVEPTDRCNLRCRMCLPHQDNPGAVHGVPAGLMPLPLFSHIVDGLAEQDCHFDHLILQWMGDPALHPELAAMVGHAARRLQGRIHYLRIDTNGLALTPQRLDGLLEAWLPWQQVPLLLVFSVDAHLEATYEEVKGGRGLLRVRHHIRHFLARRAALPVGTPLNLQLQFVVQQGNAAEASDFIRYWETTLACHSGGRGHNEILLKRLSVGAGAEGQAAADRLYDHTIQNQGIRAQRGGPVDLTLWQERPWQHDDGQHDQPRLPCPALWLTPVVRRDGQLTVCCADLAGRLALGSLAEHGFRELWHGAQANALRLAHIKGDFHTLPVCGGCGGINWIPFPPERIRRWLEGVGQAGLWATYVRRLGLEGIVSRY